jgi:hypothetical protein
MSNKYIVEYRNTETFKIEETICFSSFSEMYQHISDLGTAGFEEDYLPWHYVYKVNDDIFLAVDCKSIILEPNLDVIQKYDEIQSHLAEVYPHEETKMLFDIKKNYSSYSRSILRPLEEGAEIKPYRTFVQFNLGYEDYSVESVSENPCDIRTVFCNIDHNKLVFIITPEKGSPRINLRDIDDIQSYTFSLSSTKGPFIMVGSYKTYPQDFLCQLV